MAVLIFPSHLPIRALRDNTSRGKDNSSDGKDHTCSEGPKHLTLAKGQTKAFAVLREEGWCVAVGGPTLCSGGACTLGGNCRWFQARIMCLENPNLLK